MCVASSLSVHDEMRQPASIKLPCRYDQLHQHRDKVKPLGTHSRTPPPKPPKQARATLQMAKLTLNAFKEHGLREQREDHCDEAPHDRNDSNARKHGVPYLDLLQVAHDRHRVEEPLARAHFERHEDDREAADENRPRAPEVAERENGGDALGSEKWKDTAVELAAEVERVRVVDLKVEDVADDHHLEDHPSTDEEEENEPNQKPHVNLTI